MRTLLTALLVGGTILVIGGIACCRYGFTSMFTGLVATGCGVLFISLAAVLSVLTMLMLFKIQAGLLLYFLLGCSPAIAALVVMGPASFKLPLIHDITTDTANPPEFEFARIGRQRQDNSLNYAGAEVARQQQQAYPDIAPHTIAIPPLDLLPKVEQVADALGWKLIGSDELTLRVEAQDRSALFGFVDDVVIRLSEVGQGSRVDVRSVSRLGRGDFGANAARIRRFYRALCSAPELSCSPLQGTEISQGN
ncbi:DUF1499 domain-containing protein [Porticoccus sp. W117]|uniref:DUF1499 domain-containing protein n=1 Tax=Porticoccus sp. W117 TaxID=3054777 RepID=UPI002596A10D|nr:DUF1499 domain-containing protein [Porticoccus sp. W117]MDM3871914.1 DUF1499 domain-containing protein [Porticoccus sp. W117]